MTFESSVWSSRRYEKRQLLGSGDAGEIWRAYDRLLGREVALKLLSADAASPRAEFDVLTALEHHGIADVLDTGVLDARVYLAEELIEGAHFSRALSAQQQDSAFRGIASALMAVHDAGLIHGDVTPRNILVREDGSAVLVDFSAARAIGNTDAPSGTPGFIAPELLDGAPASASCDLFSLAQTMRSVGADTRYAGLLERMGAADPARRMHDARELLEGLGEHPSTFRVAPFRKGIVRRREACAEFLRALEQASRSVLIRGAARIGKTRFLREARWILEKREEVIELPSGRDGGWLERLSAMVGAPAAGSRTSSSSLARAIECARALRATPKPLTVLLDDEDLLPLHDRAAWWTFRASLSSATQIRFVTSCASDAPTSPDAPSTTIELHPLRRADIREWSEGRASEGTIERIFLASGGVPERVRSMLGMGEQDSVHVPDVASGWSDRERDLLIDLALFPSITLSKEDRASLSRAFVRNVLTHERSVSPSVRFASTEDARSFLSECSRSLVAARASRLLTRPLPSHADRVFLALVADESDALGLPSREEPRSHVRTELGRWKDVADLLRQRDVHLDSAATIYAELGLTRDAIRVATRAVYAAPTTANLILLAEALLRGGFPKRAIRSLEGAARRDLRSAARCNIADLHARALIQLGAYAQAVSVVDEVLATGDAQPSDSNLRAMLFESAGLARVYQDKFDEAAHCFDLCEATDVAPSSRDRVRRLSCRGISAVRAGNAARALSLYSEAAEHADAAGSTDQLASCLINVGTAAHQCAQFERAMRAYEQARVVAESLGKKSSVLSVRYNEALLCLDLGLFERAHGMLVPLREDLAREQLRHLSASATLVDGEALAFLGPSRRQEAITLVDAAIEEFGRLKANLERSEALAVRAWLEPTGPADAAKGEFPARSDLERLPLDRRLFVLSTLLSSSASDPIKADWAVLLEHSIGLADAAGFDDRTATAHAALARWHLHGGRAEKASQARASATARWQTLLQHVPAEYRAAYALHPARAIPPSDSEPAAPAPDGESRAVGSPQHLAPTDNELALRRILALNSKLNSALSTDKILDAALDLAIELSGAERGFVLEVPAAGDAASEVRVVAARNMDRETVGASHLKFSRSIADRVVSTGEPLVTVDALADARFQGTSVHAMRLRSVASVPIRGTRGVLGALYLDHRFERARFSKTTLELLSLFAEQVALALQNARLVAELAARTRELEREKARVEQKARKQEDVIADLERQVEVSQRSLALRYDYGSIVARSPAMRQLLSLVDRVIDSDVTALIRGESGAGKEVIARAIHFNGSRSKKPFVSINCAAIPETLLESQLFGHVRGAFTGAERDAEGLFSSANGGTLFLDELGDMPLGMQAKLLRALQERRVRPVGSTTDIPFDVRILAATHQDLDAAIAANRFRADLFYRLAVVELRVPPLRDRKEDIPELAQTILERAAEQGRRPAPKLARATVAALARSPWPGNVRELENTLVRAMVLTNADTIEPQHLESPRTRVAATHRHQFREREGDQILNALADARWNVAKVSRELGIPRTTLYRKMKEHGAKRGT